MARSQKLKRVSWPPDVNLCQVRLFLSEDAPSQSGLGAQDHLQAKTSWLLHSTGVRPDDTLPPGFEAPQLSIPKIPLIKWQCPRRLLLNPAWQVIAGEESKEVEIQNRREMGVLEAVYPRPSAIPPSPSVSLEAYNYQFDDLHTPLIPVTPIEDDDSTEPPDADPPINPSNISPSLHDMGGSSSSLLDQSRRNNAESTKSPCVSEKSTLGIFPNVEPDVVAAATAAFTAMMRTNEEGSLIDHDLLIKILSNPKQIEQLIKDYGTPAINPQHPKPLSSSVTPVTNPLVSTSSSDSLTPAMKSQISNPISASVTMPPPGHANRMESCVPSLGPPVSGHHYSVTNPVVAALNPCPPAGIAPIASIMKTTPALKDINYYKSLIQQHGEERQEAHDRINGNRKQYHHMGMSSETMQQSSRSRDSRGKVAKPCMYFNSARGCRNGINCMFQHDASLQQRVGSMPEAKRMKLEGEITGNS